MKIEIAGSEELMIKRVINFFDQHRILLILLILFLIISIFIGVNSYLFFHHDFEVLVCTEEIDEDYCYHKNIKILKDPENSKEEFFAEYQDEIESLQEEYHLDEFNFYTAYYYQVASRLNYEINSEYKILKDFFEAYANTYNLEEFYKDNNFYFNLFYRYKIN